MKSLLALTLAAATAAGCYEHDVCVGEECDLGGDGDVDGDTDTDADVVEASECWRYEVVDDRSAEDWPTLAIDAEGALHVAYGTGEDSNPSSLLYATNAGGSWEMKTLGYQGVRPSIAVAPSGIVHLAYMLLGTQRIEYVADPLAFPGGYVGELLPTGETSASVALALGPDEEPHVAYYEANDDEDFSADLLHATKPTGTWLADSAFGDPANFRHSMAVGSDGATHISLVRNINVDGGLFHVSNGSGAWVATRVDADGDDESAIVLDSSGDIHIVFEKRFEEIKRLAVATRADDEWTVEFVSDDSVSRSMPKLAVGDGGAIHVAACRRGDAEAIEYFFDEDGVWTGEIVDPTIRGWSRPALALDPSGRPHILYTQAPAYGEASELRHAWRECD